MLPPYVAAGEVTTLDHERLDDAVELGPLIAESLLAGAEGPEVLRRLRNLGVEKFELDAARLFYARVSIRSRWRGWNTYP